jgi:hypothetical protein
MQHSVVTPVVNDGTCTNTSSSGRRLCRLRRRSGALPRPPRADVFDSIAAFTIPYIAQLASQQEAIMSSGPRQWRSTPSRDPALLTLPVRCAPYERRSIRHHRQCTRTPCATFRCSSIQTKSTTRSHYRTATYEMSVGARTRLSSPFRGEMPQIIHHDLPNIHQIRRFADFSRPGAID